PVPARLRIVRVERGEQLVRTVLHLGMNLWCHHPVAQYQLDQAMQLERVVAVVDLREAVSVDVADGASQLDRVAQRGIQFRGDRDPADAGEQITGNRLGRKE